MDAFDIQDSQYENMDPLRAQYLQVKFMLQQMAQLLDLEADEMGCISWEEYRIEGMRKYFNELLANFMKNVVGAENPMDLGNEGFNKWKRESLAIWKKSLMLVRMHGFKEVDSQ